MMLSPQVRFMACLGYRLRNFAKLIGYFCRRRAERALRAENRPKTRHEFTLGGLTPPQRANCLISMTRRTDVP
jgi:hypothetical protein